MVAPHDARITGLRCLETGSGSAAGVAAAGTPLDVAVAVEAGAALFGTGARFAAGVQIDGVDAGAIARVEGWLAGADLALAGRPSCASTWPERPPPASPTACSACRPSCG